MLLGEQWGHNIILRAALTAWLAAQSLKVVLFILRERRFSLERLIGGGGMPSSHSALTAALTTAIGRSCGTDSAIFALAAVMTGIVMYDAAGVRRAAGKQARVINEIIREIRNEHRIRNVMLKELLGHTPTEVIVGAVLGFFIALTA